MTFTCVKCGKKSNVLWYKNLCLSCNHDRWIASFPRTVIPGQKIHMKREEDTRAYDTPVFEHSYTFATEQHMIQYVLENHQI